MKRAIVVTIVAIVVLAVAGCVSSTKYEKKLRAKFIKDAYRTCVQSGGMPSTQNTVTGNFVLCKKGRHNVIFKAEIP